MLFFFHINILNIVMTPWFLYLIRTADNMLYTGITTDVARRFTQHQSGKGAKALRGKGALALAFSAEVGERSLALRLEYRIKQLTKCQKERLVAGDGSFEALRESLLSVTVKND
ncbi:GIY-YIG nuclease family protein [Kosakonia sacchari]|uniref:GIY-YIG nuclease family protein n=1 Tax=Kosakonia sacchari TaxID=1158459 RepID=UPI003EBAC72C